MVSTDFKIRYQGSLLGYAWSLLKPLFLFLILYIVFTKFLKIGSDIPHYPVYLLLGVILWNFFTDATSTAMTSIVSRGDLIKKINIPKYLVVISTVISAFINLCLNFIVLIVLCAINHLPFSLTWLLVPVLLLELLFVVLSLGFLLSTVYVRFKDASYIWEVVLQGAFYATPILYPLSLVPRRIQEVLILNPVAQIIQDARWCIVSHDSITFWSLTQRLFWPVPIAMIIIFSAFSIQYFKAKAKYFAEDI